MSDASWRVVESRSKTAFSKRFDDALGFDRADRIRTAKVADALRGHTPRQVTRAAVSVLNFTVSGDAKTLGNSLMSFNFRHLKALRLLKVA